MPSLYEALGNIGNAAGVEGDNPAGLNALQRMGMPADQQAALNVSTSLSKLATDPDFQQMQPADQKAMIAKVTGSPAALADAAQSKFMQGLDMSNRPKAMQQLAQFLSPQDAMKLMTDPMAQGMIGAPPSAGNDNGAPAAPAGGSSAPLAAAMPATSATVAKTGSGINMQYLKTQVPPFYQNQVLDYVQGGELPSDIGAKDRTLISNWAHNVDPTFTESIAKQRAEMVKNATQGDMYKMAQTVDTGIGHLYDVHQLAGKLGNGDHSIPWGNGIENFLQSNVETGGNPDLTRYRASKGTAAPEIAKYLGGGAATVEGTKDAAAPFDERLPDSQIQGNAVDLGAKMITKAGSLQDEYNQTMGQFGRHKILSDQSKALYSDMQNLPLTLQQQQLVNQHRAEANLPLKKWGKDQTVTNPVDIRPADQPKNAPTATASTPAASGAAPQFSAQQIQAEIARRRTAGK